MDIDKTDTVTIDLSSIDLSSLTNDANYAYSTGAWDPAYGAVPPNVRITSSPMLGASGSPNTIWTTSGTNTIWNDISADGFKLAPGKLTLTGDDADIDVNGVSLMDTIRGIQDRLNILCPDPEMEQEWDELRELRAQYEAKLAECREKSRAWKALKQQG